MQHHRQVIVSNTFRLSCGSRQKPIVQTYQQNTLSSIKAHLSKLCCSKPRFSRYSSSLRAISHPHDIYIYIMTLYFGQECEFAVCAHLQFIWTHSEFVQINCKHTHTQTAKTNQLQKGVLNSSNCSAQERNSTKHSQATHALP